MGEGQLLSVETSVTVHKQFNDGSQTTQWHVYVFVNQVVQSHCVG